VVTDAAGRSVGYRETIEVGSPATAAPSSDPCGRVCDAVVGRVAHGKE
jgi:hypothetical protein